MTHSMFSLATAGVLAASSISAIADERKAVVMTPELVRLADLVAWTTRNHADASKALQPKGGLGICSVERREVEVGTDPLETNRFHYRLQSCGIHPADGTIPLGTVVVLDVVRRGRGGLHHAYRVLTVVAARPGEKP